jgi:hypothetical protein
VGDLRPRFGQVRKKEWGTCRRSGGLIMHVEAQNRRKCSSIVSKPGEFLRKSAQKPKNTAKKNIFAFLIKIRPSFGSKISDPGI